VWVLVTVRSASWLILVGSFAVSFAMIISPPPDRVAVFVTVAGALAETFTVRVIVG